MPIVLPGRASRIGFFEDKDKRPYLVIETLVWFGIVIRVPLTCSNARELARDLTHFQDAADAAAREDT